MGKSLVDKGYLYHFPLDLISLRHLNQFFSYLFFNSLKQVQLFNLFGIFNSWILQAWIVDFSFFLNCLFVGGGFVLLGF